MWRQLFVPCFLPFSHRLLQNSIHDDAGPPVPIQTVPNEDSGQAQTESVESKVDYI